jgi:hypothetical protein
MHRTALCDGDTRRTRVNRNVEDEAAAGAAARATCDVGTLRGTYLFADHGVDATTGKPYAGAGYEYFDGVITKRESSKGTYKVNADCTGRSTYPGDVEYKYDLFIDPGGDNTATLAGLKC